MSDSSKRSSLSRYTFNPDHPKLQATDSDEEMDPLLDSKRDPNTPDLTMTSTGMFRMFACSFIATIGSLIFGYCLGFTSPAFRDVTLVGGTSNRGILSSAAQDSFSSLINIGAAVGGVSSGAIAAKFGRKGTILFAGLPYAFGWLLILLPAYLHTIFPPHLNSVVVVLLIVGRILSGLGLGISSGITSIYIAEIATPKYRGFLGTCFQVTVTLGLLLVYALGLPFSHYAWLATIAIALCASLVILGLWITESPHALLMKKRPDEAQRALQWLRGGPGVDVNRELQYIESTLSNQESFALSEFKKPAVWKPLFITIGLMFFQQFCGINAVAFYASEIFKKSGSSFQDHWGPFIIAADQTLSTILAALIMDRLGRRKLLVLSGTLMCASSIALGVFFHLNSCLNFANPAAHGMKCPDNFHPKIGSLSLVSLIIYMTGFSFGWGAIPWLVMSEILPTKARAIAAGICTGFVWLCSYAVTQMFPYLTHKINMDGTFWFFGGFAFASVVFVLLFVPETKGKTLEDIELYFEGKSRSSLND